MKTIKLFTVLLICIIVVSAFSPAVFRAKLSHSDALMKPMNDMMERMKKINMTGHLDHDFAAMMVEHHQGAIDMTTVYLKEAKDEKLKAMAQKAMAKQKEEQVELKKYADDQKSGTSHEHHKALMSPMDNTMEQMRKMKMTGNMDKDFAMMMIEHHKSAIEMAKYEAAKGTSEDLKKMANDMIENQQKEIKELQSFAK